MKKAGGALVTPDAEHHYNLPDGVRYELQGEGLIFDDAPSGTGRLAPIPDNPLDVLNGNAEPPFSSNPLDTLNKGKGKL